MPRFQSATVGGGDCRWRFILTTTTKPDDSYGQLRTIMDGALKSYGVDWSDAFGRQRWGCLRRHPAIVAARMAAFAAAVKAGRWSTVEIGAACGCDGSTVRTALRRAACQATAAAKGVAE